MPRAIQAKLAVGQVDDPLEHEADRVADEVMRTPAPELSISGSPKQISRTIGDAGSRTADPLEAGDGAAALVHRALRSPAQLLDPGAREFFEPRFGREFADVRVHAGDEAAASARTLDARAYTVGRHVVFGQDRYRPGSLEGKRLLAHELAHVVQQQGAPAAGRRSAALIQRAPDGGGQASPKPDKPDQTPRSEGVDLGGQWFDDGTYWMFDDASGMTWVWSETAQSWTLLATAREAIAFQGSAPKPPAPPPKPKAPDKPLANNPYANWVKGIGNRWAQQHGVVLGIGAAPVAEGAGFVLELNSALAGSYVPVTGLGVPFWQRARKDMRDIRDQWDREAEERDKQTAELKGELFRAPVTVALTNKPVGGKTTIRPNAPRRPPPVEQRVKTFVDNLADVYREEVDRASARTPKPSASEIGRIAERETLARVDRLAERAGLDPGHIWVGDFPVGVTGPKGGVSTAEIGSLRYKFIIELKKSPKAVRGPQAEAHLVAVEEMVNFEKGVAYHRIYGENYEGEGIDTIEVEPEAEPVVEVAP